jgi:hypothetical protein
MYEYNFAITERDPALGRAMNIAMTTLKQTGRAQHFVNVEGLVSCEILSLE